MDDRNFEEAVKQMKLSTLPDRVSWKMACHLDSLCSDSNWKSLAEKRGLSYLEIKSIEDRVCYKKHCSCTLMLFEERLCPMNLTLHDLVLSLSAIGNKACVHVLKEAFQNGELTAVRNAQTPVLDLQTVIAEDKRSLKTVFLTYSEDSIKPAKAISRWLTKNRCTVSLDILDIGSMYKDRIGWYDTKYKEADYVLILVSPQYSTDVAGKGKSEVSLAARYIHSRMQAEYMRNQCINKRFIPVVLPGAIFDHLPIWLQHRTTVYQWPNHFKSIFLHIHEFLDYSSRIIQQTPMITISTLESPSAAVH